MSETAHSLLSNPPSSHVEPIAYAIDDVPLATGATRTKVYTAVREKELTARKIGRSTIIEVDELKRWLRTLPTRGRVPGSEAA